MINKEVYLKVTFNFSVKGHVTVVHCIAFEHAWLHTQQKQDGCFDNELLAKDVYSG